MRNRDDPDFVIPKAASMQGDGAGPVERENKELKI